MKTVSIINILVEWAQKQDLYACQMMYFNLFYLPRNYNYIPLRSFWFSINSMVDSQLRETLRNHLFRLSSSNDSHSNGFFLTHKVRLL